MACYNTFMIFEMLRWWYVTGWLQSVKRISSWTARVEHAFSLSLLARTLFSPWRRIVTPPGKGLDARMHAALDNLVSRSIGSVIRLTVIIAAGVALFCTFLAGIIVVVVWPLLPVLAVLLAVKAVIG